MHPRVLLLELLRPRHPRFPRSFGAREAALQSVYGSVEWTLRHLRILNELEALRADRGLERMEVLDFGGAAAALAKVVEAFGLGPRYRVFLVDTDRAALAAAPTRPPVVAALAIDPEGVLPFRDRSLDAVVSSDVFEHIPREARARWAAECRRVARSGQVHTVPCDGGGGRFGGAAADREFDAWHREAFGAPERYTAEHLAHGIPTEEELRLLFPGARVEGFGNTGVWMELVRRQFTGKTPLGRVLDGAWYARRGRARDGEPPFKNALVVERAAGVGP